jgi:16S rRNA (uracil1498-N3)-methyltransferase
MIRLLLPKDALTSKAVRVTGERFHHLAHVLRAAKGDELEVFDGAGNSYEATLTHLGAGEAELSLGERRAADLQRAVLLVQGLPKADKLEWTLQKATELGAFGFHPVTTERSVVKLSLEREPARRRRWQRIVEEAARQCGRSDVPSVEPLKPLLLACERLAQSALVVVLDEEERSVSLSEATLEAGRARAIALVVGPEGGLGRGEVEALKALGARTASLGRLTLRTETAGLAALCVLRHREGLLG